MRVFATTALVSLAVVIGTPWRQAANAQTGWPGEGYVAEAAHVRPAAYQDDTTGEGIRGLPADTPATNGTGQPAAASCGCGNGGGFAAAGDRCRAFGLGCACWSFSADAVAMQRTNTRNQPLLEPGPSTLLLPELNAQHLDFPVALGFQLGAVRHGPCGWDLELGYFQIDGWEATAYRPGVSYMNTDVHGENFIVRDAQVRYTSALHLGEINLRREWFDGLTLLAGFRMGELDEVYGADAIGARVPVPVSVGVHTFNHLYGFQLGADYEIYNMGRPLRISALCKAGIYANAASQRIRQIDTGFTDETLSASRDQTAFLGEAGLKLTYQLTRHLAFRASYSAVWLEGVALAPEQINSTDFLAGTAEINTTGGIFYHGGTLGMELKF